METSCDKPASAACPERSVRPMAPRVFILLVSLLTLAGGAWWIYRARVSAPGTAGQGANPPESVPSKGSPNSVQLEQNKAVVFQRAFWRRPEKGDRIIAAERRDWLDETSAVQKWQWFVTVDPSPGFRRWLLDDNPFEVTAVVAGTPPPALENTPPWFPARSELAAYLQYRTRGSRLAIFLDPKSGQLFAADSGAGFAAALR